MTTEKDDTGRKALDSAEIGALAHLYRAEVYRSTIWRTRLDTTTNWAVVTLGIALSITFASPDASALPLVLVGVLLMFFLLVEARRYRFFNVWRARCRWMETHFYAPMLHDGDLHLEENWQKTLAEDYWHPKYHVSLLISVGRRIRSTYLWILLIQALAYLSKLVVHPVAATSVSDVFERANVGPVPGWVMVTLGVLYIAVSLVVAGWSIAYDRERAARGRRASGSGMG
ncbi:DUF2270 domain-containing protein [Thalassorhabdomicrobium marinisediminis]|uniref:DUF2270 domain-containing protein n=1 Tax=Thalassorhabdomicrobium marinisediminis TaxID=2170577 RepID=A0A2T7FW60_9RHOB|nr:DUF2270 domain-containing protein [Thalassorhabdomicrobium marinisediminis]PVA06406.1 hypothetical protein DC363_10915 [Thalassorhabdomicrobium marinisediminis]